MKKVGLKIAALIVSAALLLTGCSCGSAAPEVTEGTTEDTAAATAEETSVSTTAQSVASQSSPNTTEPEKTTSVQTTANAATSDSETDNEENSGGSSSNSSGGSSSGNSSGSSSGNSSNSSEGTVTTTKTESEKVPQNNTSGSFSTSWNPSNTWQENGNYCGTCELNVTNNTGSDVKGWTAKMTVPDGFKITSSWNGKFSVSGTTLTVTNESYNGDIAKGAKISFGFNYSSPSKFNPPDTVTINGNASSSGNSGNSGGSSGSSGGNSGGNSGGSTDVKPLPAPAVIGLVKDHGKLSVKGTQLVDKNGKNFQLKGMSTHGLAWFPGFVNENAFKTLRDDWNTNVIRLAMYSGENSGYCTGGNKEELKALIDKGVQAAAKLGMYVIIDWHVLGDQNPNTYKSEAKAFFEEMSKKYSKYDNVLYEICNEPNGSTTWNDVKSYAEEVIPIIRKNSPDSVIIVGTPTWSQDIDKAAADPLTEKNVLYALHFYAATHTDWLRQRLTDCYNKGLPVFVSEFGTCDASGNGANDFGQAKSWLNLLDKYGISYVNWNLANKNESSSAFKESASTDGNWSSNDYSESGAWMRKWFRGEIS